MQIFGRRNLVRFRWNHERYKQRRTKNVFRKVSRKSSRALSLVKLRVWTNTTTKTVCLSLFRGFPVACVRVIFILNVPETRVNIEIAFLGSARVIIAPLRERDCLLNPLDNSRNSQPFTFWKDVFSARIQPVFGLVNERHYAVSAVFSAEVQIYPMGTEI